MKRFLILNVLLILGLSQFSTAKENSQSDTLSLLCQKWYLAKVIVLDSMVNVAAFDTISYPITDTTFFEFIPDGTLKIIDSKKNNLSTEWSFDAQPGIIDLISNDLVYDNFKIVHLSATELKYIAYTYSDADRKYKKGLFKFLPI